MSRRKLVVISVCLLLTLGGTGAFVVWALMQTPDFYAAALRAQSDPAQRKENAKQLIQRTVNLMEEIESQDRWSEEFTQQQINGWLAEELPTRYSKWMPEGVEEPRVQLSEKTIRLGVRVDQEDWQGVVSLTLRPWVAGPNQVALQVESIRAGLMPVPLQSVMEHVKPYLKDDDRWRVQWSQQDGKDVAVIQFVADGQPQPVLEQIEVVDGALRLGGRGSASFDPSQMSESTVAGGRKAFDSARR